MIFICVKWKVKPEYADQWVELTREFTEATRAEPGNLFFDWSRSVDDPNLFVLVEAFKDVSNTHTGQTPGHMNVYPFGQTFVDPGPGSGILIIDARAGIDEFFGRLNNWLNPPPEPGEIPFSRCVVPPLVGMRGIGGIGGARFIAPAPNARIIFGHGARHLAGSGLSQAAVESAIETAVRATPTTHTGWVQVQGQWIQYRAYVLADGRINIGTYVRVPGNLSNARVP